MRTFVTPFHHWSLFIILLLLSACDKKEKEPEKNTSALSKYPVISPVELDLDRIKARGSLIAIVDNSSTGYFIYRGRPMGYEYELLKLLARHLEVNLETVLTNGIEQAFYMLNKGEGDIVAYSLTVTKARRQVVAFTDLHFTTRQVLVQKKPDNWRKITADQTEKQLIRNQVDLIGKQVHVRSGSSYIERLHNLSHEIGGDIIVVEEPDSVETETLIKSVARGEIALTVADEMVAHVNASYYPSIDTKTPVSFPQRIAWAVRKNSPALLKSINGWLKALKQEPTFNVIYNRYFKNPRTSKRRASGEFASFTGGKLSPYDDLAKKIAEPLGWDWRLVVAQMYHESRFDPNVRSWAGAMGLMQLMPDTGRAYGAENLLSPKQNTAAAGKYLVFLDQLWADTIEDNEERIKFVLASYNVGQGHVQDAVRLAEKYDHTPTVWNDNVEKFVRLKSKREYFTDPVVKFGYCRGDEPANYVKEIMEFYTLYQQLIAK